MSKCAICGEEIPDDATKCRFCGQFVKPSRSRKATFRIALGIALVGLCVLGWTVLMLYPKPQRPVTGNKAHDDLMTLREEAREAAFERVLLGKPCGAVVSTYYQGVNATADAFWSVGCGTGRKYQVTVKNDAGGSLTIQDCDTVKESGSVECFQPLSGQ
jgi:predicted nucleic acid-binding Zn ribbon protein